MLINNNFSFVLQLKRRRESSKMKIHLRLVSLKSKVKHHFNLIKILHWLQMCLQNSSNMKKTRDLFLRVQLEKDRKMILLDANLNLKILLKQLILKKLLRENLCMKLGKINKMIIMKIV